jgi:hypothetical protein
MDKIKKRIVLRVNFLLKIFVFSVFSAVSKSLLVKIFLSAFDRIKIDTVFYQFVLPVRFGN